MKKIIENVIPFPVGCETSRFFGAFTSMHMCIQKVEPKNLEHEFKFHVFYSVTGAGLFRLHQTDIPHTIRGYNADEIISFIHDYIHYAMLYAGYEYVKLTGIEGDRNVIWDAIVQSINKDYPVLFKGSGSIQWNLICGYNEDGMNLYGLDAKGCYNEYTPVKPEGYLDNGYFYDKNWFESLEYILICKPGKNLKISFKSALKRISSIMEMHISHGLNKNCLLLKNSDDYFLGQNEDDLKNLYAYIDSLLGYLMECSHHVSEAFGAVWKSHIDNPVVNPVLQDLFSTLDTVITNTQAIVWEHWNYKPEGIEKYMMLKNKTDRDRLLSYFYRILEDDKKALELIRDVMNMIDSDYVDLSI